MQIGGKRIRVKLKDDLTRYHPKLKKGTKGWTMPDAKLSIWGGSDCFVAVSFDNDLRWDVLWKSLETIKK